MAPQYAPSSSVIVAATCGAPAQRPPVLHGASCITPGGILERSVLQGAGRDSSRDPRVEALTFALRGLAGNQRCPGRPGNRFNVIEVLSDDQRRRPGMPRQDVSRQGAFERIFRGNAKFFAW